MGAIQPSKKRRIIINSDSEEDVQQHLCILMYAHTFIHLLNYPCNCFYMQLGKHDFKALKLIGDSMVCCGIWD